jgi:hypothetical protein
MGPNALFSFDHFNNLTIYYPLTAFRRLPCSSSTGINNRAAGRRAVVMVFASPSGQLYRDTEILPTYQDYAKTHANPDTDGNSPYHQAVGFNSRRLSDHGRTVLLDTFNNS